MGLYVDTDTKLLCWNTLTTSSESRTTTYEGQGFDSGDRSIGRSAWIALRALKDQKGDDQRELSDQIDERG